MCSVTRLNRIGNEYITKKLEVTNIIGKTRGKGLRRFGHVKRSRQWRGSWDRGNKNRDKSAGEEEEVAGGCIGK